MLTFYLNRESDYPLYEQLYEQLKKTIVDDDLKYGEKMPSKRALANHLKVSLSTIEQAYYQLLAEGYIIAIEKKGYYVHYDQSLIITSKPIPVTALRKSKSNKQSYRYHFKTNLVDETLFPLSTWLKMSKKLLNEDLNELVNQSDPKGLLDLRLEIKSYLKQFRGMDVSEHQIIMGAGSEVLLSLISDLIGHNQLIGIENPGFQKIHHILRNKHRIIPINLDSEGLMINTPEVDRLNVIHITPSHQFPSGIVMPIARRLSCLSWANKKENRYIIEDDYDSEYRFVGQPIKALYALDHQQKVIYLNSFSKSLGPTMRLSYMVLPPMLLKLYEEKMLGYRQTISNITQYTLTYFMKEGWFYKHLNKTKVKYKQKRDELIKALKNSTFGHLIDIKNADAGLHFIITHDKISASTLSQKAKEVGLEVKTLKEHLYQPNAYIQDGLVMGYAHLILTDLNDMIERLEKVWI
jgi:GntR family transcriptional regulator / MocR family aminotransferase